MENDYVNCDCPYCGCGSWKIKPKKDNITGHAISFDDDKAWVVAICDDCEKEFEVEYKATRIRNKEEMEKAHE